MLVAIQYLTFWQLFKVLQSVRYIGFVVDTITAYRYLIYTIPKEDVDIATYRYTICITDNTQITV